MAKKKVVGVKTKAVAAEQPATDQKEKYGIEQASPVIAFAARTVTDIAFIDEDQDGRVEGNEILSFGWKRSQDAFALFREWDWSLFQKELKDLDAAERDSLIETFAADFKLRKLEAEILLEDMLRWLNDGANLVGRIKKVMKAEPAV